MMRTHPKPVTVPISSFAQAASAPAQLMNLRTLKLIECSLMTEEDEDQKASHSCINIVLPLLAAPALTHMFLTSNVAYISWAELAHILRKYSSLATLDVHVDTDMRSGVVEQAGMRPRLPLNSKTGSTYTSRESLHTVGIAETESSPAFLPRLQNLRIRSECAITPLQIAATVAKPASRSLIGLSLTHTHGHCDTWTSSLNKQVLTRGVQSLSGENMGSAWDAAIVALAECHQLQHLKWPMPSSAHSCSTADGPDRNEALAAAIERLVQLTELHLDSVCPQCLARADISCACTVHGVALGQALLRMRQLDRLHIGGGSEVSVSGPEQFFSALPAVRSLTALVLNCGAREFEQDVIADAVGKMRALKELKLAPGMFGVGHGDAGVATVEEFTARLPTVNVSVCVDGERCSVMHAQCGC